ncbi:ANTAR domain-containing protein [Rhodococcus opacus]|nr:ANTAR domain-containing protein [Rhodococcus opacus]
MSEDRPEIGDDADRSGAGGPEGASAVDRVLAAGAPQRVGSFRYHSADDTWEWSDAVAAMHGYPPGQVVPTTELLLSHKHPDDKAAVTDVLDRMRRTGDPFSSRHRIIDTTGNLHYVVVVGDRLTDSTGDTVGTVGFYIDVTETLRTQLCENADNAVSEAVESRSVIDQAKGALMLAYGISADRAFDVLVWRSQQTNTKVREIAQNLVSGVARMEPLPPQQRRQIDHLLLTSHTGEQTAS